MKTLIAVSALLVCAHLFAASPSFQQFNVNQFGTGASDQVVVKSGARFTNAVENSPTIQQSARWRSTNNSPTDPIFQDFDIANSDTLSMRHSGAEIFFGITNGGAQNSIDFNINGENEYTIIGVQPGTEPQLFHRFYLGTNGGILVKYFEIGTNGVGASRFYGSGLLITNSAASGVVVFSPASGRSFTILTNGNIVLGTNDVNLVPESTNTLALRNSTAAQQFKVYNTFSGTGNNEYFQVRWVANTCQLVTRVDGSGTSRAIYLKTEGNAPVQLTANNTDRWFVDGPTGNFLPNADNTTSVGSATARLSVVYSFGVASYATNRIAFTTVSSCTNTLGWDGTASVSAGTSVVLQDSSGNTIDTIGTVATLHVIIPMRANYRLSGTGISCVIY